jgi:hypothetical protein
VGCYMDGGKRRLSAILCEAKETVMCLCPVLAMLAHRVLSPLGADRLLFNFVVAVVESPLNHVTFVV